MLHIVSLSGGMSSAIAADRVIARYGKTATRLWFADTSWEDEDLFRFLRDLHNRWQMKIVRYRDGRTPLQVASDASIIPNSKIAPCTFKLKIEPFTKVLERISKPVTVHIGMGWKEPHRFKVPQERYEQIPGVSVDFPLMWDPVETRPPEEVLNSWGIAAPRLYALGFGHNNCGGRCVKQGNYEWQRLLATMPERYAEVETWETEQRAKGGPRSTYAIARSRVGGVSTPLPLSELRLRPIPPKLQGELDDREGCFCSY